MQFFDRKGQPLEHLMKGVSNTRPRDTVFDRMITEFERVLAGVLEAFERQSLHVFALLDKLLTALIGTSVAVPGLMGKDQVLDVAAISPLYHLYIRQILNATLHFITKP